MRIAGILAAIAAVTVVTIVLMLTYGGISDEIVQKIERVPGQHDELLSRREAAHVWKEIYDLELTGTGIRSERISFDTGRAAVLDRGRQEAMLIDTATKNYEPLASLPGRASAILADEGEVFLWADGVYLYDEDKQTWIPRTDEIVLPEEIEVLRLFDHNFYAAGKNGIYKLTFKDGQYQETSKWLAEGERVTDISDIYLDGHVYAASVGAVSKLLRGREVTWALEASVSGRLYLDGDYREQILVLVPEREELIFADSKGKTLLVSRDSFLREAAALGLQEADGSIFVLINQRIYQYDGERPETGDQKTSD